MPANKFRADVLEVQSELKKAEYALDVRRYDLALDLLRKMLQAHPENSAIFYTLARAYFFKKNWPAASQAIRESLRLDPQSSQSHALYGGILLNMKKVSEAEVEYRLSLTLNPMNATAHYVYATLLLEKAKKVLAFMVLEKSVNIVRAQTEKQENLVQAEEHARKALELDPAVANHHKAMAEVYAFQEKFEDAEQEFQRALSLDPEGVLVHRSYGAYLLHKRNEPARALEHLRQAMRLEPNHPETRKIFIEALKANYKRYRFVWQANRLLKTPKGRTIFFLTMLAILVLTNLTQAWADDLLVEIINILFVFLRNFRLSRTLSKNRPKIARIWEEKQVIKCNLYVIL
jgi:Tfp pilus assembly protein PilF